LNNIARIKKYDLSATEVMTFIQEEIL